MKVKIGLALYLLLSIVCLASATEEGNSIGYSSVAAALQDLKARPDAQITMEQGWTFVDIDSEKEKEMTLWSFTPKTHPAHPSAIKRDVFEKDGAVFIRMNVLCEAPKDECDALTKAFEQLNDNIRDKLQVAP